MPRLARLDAVGLLQHVMVRGIEKRDIFLDDHDRRSFLERLSKLLLKTETACLAWCLMSNHFHLLLRPQRTKLSFLMRRLLTGYAVTFNLRHKRVGHLFQNRYKSIVCEEDPYLLELIRYIHLNPVRADLVSDAPGLERYPWSGHAVIMGVGELPGQATTEVLSRFGKRPTEARQNYCSFVMEAAYKGHREEFSGGGLVRSSFFLGLNPAEEAYDQRILGSGEFVEDVWGEQEEQNLAAPVSLKAVVDEVAAGYGIVRDMLCHPNKNRKISEARAIVCYLALRELRVSAVEVAKVLEISTSGVSVAAKRGETLTKTKIYSEITANLRISATSP